MEDPRKAVFDLLADLPYTAREISERTNLPLKQVQTVLRRAQDFGRVQRCGIGRLGQPSYRLTASGRRTYASIDDRSSSGE